MLHMTPHHVTVVKTKTNAVPRLGLKFSISKSQSRRFDYLQHLKAVLEVNRFEKESSMRLTRWPLYYLSSAKRMIF